MGDPAGFLLVGAGVLLSWIPRAVLVICHVEHRSRIGAG
jgi:hypothetical protein